MKLPLEKIVLSENETAEVAAEFAAILKIGDTVCLNGNLGSGKTLFVKSICKEFSIDTTTSPSFSIVNVYLGQVKVIHIDFYRLKKVEDLYDIGFDEYLTDADSIVFIEWSNLFVEVLPKKYYSIEISHVDETTRQLIIKSHE